MLSPARAEALRSKHGLLTKQIEFEENRPAVNRGLVVSLKRERLAIKETLEGLRPDQYTTAAAGTA